MTVAAFPSAGSTLPPRRSRRVGPARPARDPSPPVSPAAAGHVGSHSRYSAGCRCPGCTAAHRVYLADWRAGRVAGRVDTGPVRAHLRTLAGSGLVLGYLDDEAGVPRGTVYRIWRGAARTSAGVADRLLALRPLDPAAALPTPVRLADARGPVARRAAAGDLLDPNGGSAAVAAARLGVSRRTAARWRARQAGRAS